MINVRHFLLTRENDMGFFDRNIKMTVTKGSEKDGR